MGMQLFGKSYVGKWQVNGRRKFVQLPKKNQAFFSYKELVVKKNEFQGCANLNDQLSHKPRFFIKFLHQSFSPEKEKFAHFVPSSSD